MSRRHSQPAKRDDRAARWAANGEQAGGHRHRTQDAPTGFAHANAIGCTGTQGPCSSAAAPPPGRRPEHTIDRLTPIRPQMGRLLEHGVSANGLTRCMQARSAPARAECAHRRAFKVHPRCSNRVAMLQHTRTTVTTMTEDKTMVDALASYTGTVMR